MVVEREVVAEVSENAAESVVEPTSQEPSQPEQDEAAEIETAEAEELVDVMEAADAEISAELDEAIARLDAAATACEAPAPA